jgi:predicted ester cyclase
MALTLLEAAKLVSGNVQRAGIIELFARNSDILAALPFEDIPGGALSYNQEGALPGVAFRGVNEAYTEGVGVINPVTEVLTIAGGDLDVDRSLIRTRGAGVRAVHEAMKVKALAQTWHLKFIKGDSSSTPKEFDGLQSRLTGDQLIANSAASGGAGLSLAKLDEAIDAVDDATHLIMSKSVKRRFAAAGRATAISGYVTHTTDSFGRPVTKYNDLPILVADASDIASGNRGLAFDETPSGGGSDSTSVYVVAFREGMLTGIQNGSMEVMDLGQQDSKPVMRTRIEWLSGMALMHPRAACRLADIDDAAITA